MYAALFHASSEALRALAADPKFVGTVRLGFFGVLHTWGRTLDYHRHVHYVVPGGGIDQDDGRWLPSRADFLVPVKALSILFRAKFRDILAREDLLRLVDPAAWRRHWVVHSRAAGDGRTSLRYLAPYVCRVAIGNHRIVSCDDGKVTFTYRRVGSNRPRKMTLDATEFLHRYLQHVLSAGFQNVRHPDRRWYWPMRRTSRSNCWTRSSLRRTSTSWSRCPISPACARNYANCPPRCSSRVGQVTQRRSWPTPPRTARQDRSTSTFSGRKNDPRSTTSRRSSTADNLRHVHEDLRARLRAEGIDPGIPWLYGFRLEFCFR